MRAAGYIRVSDTSQIENFSLSAQERLFYELCKNRDWKPVRVYREEGKSARYDAIAKRPVFRQLLADCTKGEFDVIVSHSLDRFSRNLKVTLDSFSVLSQHNITFVSITEAIDYTTPEGRLFIAMLGGFAQYFSDSLGKHVRKGLSELATRGLHAGSIPFGYEHCQCHPARVHPHPIEAPAVKALFEKYASGAYSMGQLAAWLNSQGLRTRNNRSLKDGHGNPVTGPRMFTNASVRWLLHNPFFMGKVSYSGNFYQGQHEPLVSESLFEAVQRQAKQNNFRSETLNSRPHRVYPLKGLAKCAYCGMPLWSETLKNKHSYYREPSGPTGHGDCRARGKTLACHIADEQIGKLIEALTLEDTWREFVLSRLSTLDERERTAREQTNLQQQLKRLGRTFVDGLIDENDYHAQQQVLKTRLDALVAPEEMETISAGELLSNLGTLWKEAVMEERRRILLGMLNAVYIDLVQTRSVVAIAPKPAFRKLFGIVATRPESGITILEKAAPAHTFEAGAESMLWWRRGRVELPAKPAATNYN